jgi:asparagine synthase (glutamine-hydrolysing)
MCGICGIVTFGGPMTDLDRRAAVDAMLAALRHRGPDALGHAGDLQARLGATRLAIRGMDEGGQPVQDVESGVLVVCNGEIDNHDALRQWLKAQGREVASGADIAVLPGLYLELGAQFVERLVGAFAIAVWDPRRGALLLARDRAGERSLFYRAGEGAVRFASELSALAADKGRPADAAALRRFLHTGCFLGGDTPLQGVAQVAPGEVLTFDAAEGPARRQYWRWSPKPRAAPDVSVAAFDPVFRQAVARQSEVDVEYGIFLSGGLDSSLVAAVASEIRPGKTCKAYTLRFAEESYDEGDWAMQVADSLGLETIAVEVTPEAFPEALADLIAHCGEPLSDPAWIPTALLARRAAQDVKVALVGEGADELFGGYPTYIGGLAAERYNRAPAVFRSLFKAAVERWPVSDRKVALSYLLKRFGARPAEPARRLDVVDFGADAAAARPCAVARRTAGRAARARPPGRAAALRPGERAGGGAADQGRQGRHALGGGNARAVPRSWGHGVRGRASGGGAGARLHHEGLPQAIRRALSAEARHPPQEARPVRAAEPLAARPAAGLGAGAAGIARAGGIRRRPPGRLGPAGRALPRRRRSCAGALDPDRRRRVAGLAGAGRAPLGAAWI